MPLLVRDAHAQPRDPTPAAPPVPTVRVRPDASGPGELVRRVRLGDHDAFRELYQRHARLVHGLLLAHADRDDVDDMVQDVFITAYERLETLKDTAAFAGWIATIARNRARMHHRARRPTVAIPEELPAGGAPDDSLRAAEVLSALRGVAERFREPLVLRLVEEMSGEEIARATGLSHGTVRVYLHHGMAQLRELLGGWNERT